MSFKNTKKIITESTQFMRKHGFDPVRDHLKIYGDDASFDLWSNALAEGLSGDTKDTFLTLCENFREPLLMETSYGFNPISPLVMPIFRKLWPNLIVREAVTVLPMDKPEIMHAFMVAVAKVGKNEYELPDINRPISADKAFGTMTTELPPMEIACPSSVNILEANSLDVTKAHIAKDVQIIGVVRDDGTKVENILIEPDDDGNFAFDVACGDTVDYVSGNINYFNGIVHCSSSRAAQTEDKVAKVLFVGSITQAEEMISPKIELKHVKLPIRAVDHEVSAEWSIQYEQDAKAYYDLDVQSKLVDTFGQIVGMDIDRRMISKILMETERFNATSVGTGSADDPFTFSQTPTSGYAFGRKEWADQIAVNLGALSAKLKTDTFIDEPIVVLANTIDSNIFVSTGNFEYNGDSYKGGEFADKPVSGTYSNSYKILCSPLIPKGKMIVMIKPENPDNAVFLFAPYKPVTLTPFPLGNKPAMTFLSRYGSRFVRREGAGVLRII